MKQTFGIGIPNTLEDVCNPRYMALLIYDMQVGIKSQIEGGDLVVANVRKVLEAARLAHVRVFFTRHMSLPKELMGAFQYRMAMAWQGRKSCAVVSARHARLRDLARTQTSAERSNFRQNHDVGLRRHAAPDCAAGLRHQRGSHRR